MSKRFPLIAMMLTAAVCNGDVTIRNTESGSPMAAAQALKSLALPKNFAATLFASEPWVRQPIDMKVDSRGRVWIAEAYWYPNNAGTLQDRITVLEDLDGDGKADKRMIFASGLDHLMSIEVGFGGVWVLAPPKLVFYPDADGDMKPDGAPRILATGFNTNGSWNMANGLKFGPDGWLYGRQGQMGTSTPRSVAGASPGSFSSGIWRYHPPSGKLEIVAQGMTNPWGLDWNEDGELFASGNCNGHLWHIVGGSLYDWGFGAREFSWEYGRTLPIEAAPHYSPGKDWWASWQERFEKADSNNEYGGGHSHCGLLICNGTSWPEAMRGHTLMSNIHGHRINEDTIEAKGSSYVSRHVGDPIKAGDPWFRGVSVEPAPDGAFFISDWSDTGECHDKSGIHQDSARVFRIVPAPVEPVAAMDGMDDATLLAKLAGSREEPVRQAMKILQQRSLVKKVGSDTRAKLVEMLANADWKLRLRALSALHGGSMLDNDSLLAASRDADDRVRACAVRYWAEREKPETTGARFREMAENDPSPRVQLHLASVTRNLSERLRDSLTVALIGRQKSQIDARTAHLLWHIQAQNEEFSTEKARELIKGCQSQEFAAYLARYLVENDGIEGLNTVFTLAASRENPVSLLNAVVSAAREGQISIHSAPPQWPECRAKWMASTDNSIRGAALAAAIMFGDHDALEGLRKKVQASDATLDEKILAIETLAAAQTTDSIRIIGDAYRDKTLRVPAIRALRHFKQPGIADNLIESWARLDDAERHAAVETLTSRKEWALVLLTAMGPDGIKPEYLSAAQARNLSESGDPALTAAVLKNWGSPTKSSNQKEASLARATQLIAGKNTGDPKKGHLLFSQSCGVCHTLYGEGGKLGPDLTGRNRADLASLVRSIVDPSAEVPEEGRLAIVNRTDGSIASGIIISKNASGITLRGQQGDMQIKNEAISEIRTQTTSPMPEGLLDNLTDDQLHDLFAYLRADQADEKK